MMALRKGPQGGKRLQDHGFFHVASLARMPLSFLGNAVRNSCWRHYLVICEEGNLLFCASRHSLTQLKRYCCREPKDLLDARSCLFKQ